VHTHSCQDARSASIQLHLSEGHRQRVKSHIFQHNYGRQELLAIKAVGEAAPDNLASNFE
jgi:hypothetical protein